MIFSDSLEVAIGLSFIFVMMSLALTTVNEMVELITKSRGRNLQRNGRASDLLAAGP